MSDAKMVSERDAILRERAAFVNGAAARDRAVVFGMHPVGLVTALHSSDGTGKAEEVAAKVYPFPKVTRPRVVRSMWADLLAHPTEEVDDV